VRAVRACSTDKFSQSNNRVGRDGRSRPLNSAASRILAGYLIRENPDIPLRKVASAAGIAPSTALDVRTRVREGLDPVPKALRRKERRGSAPEAERSEFQWEPALRRLRVDPSLRFTEAGRVLLRLFDARLLSPDGRTTLTKNIPAHCTQAIAQLARLVGDAWLELAAELERCGVDA
jgi:hypothetical protein